jgi:uncharacterized protein
MRYLRMAAIICILTGKMVYAWDSTKIDTVENRYDNGRLKEKYQRVLSGGNDEYYKYGFYRSWYPNGQMEWDGHYAENGKIGVWMKWDSLGCRVEETSYIGDKKNGLSIEWNRDGSVATLLRYRNDKLHGRCCWLQHGSIINDFFNNPDLPFDSDFFYIEGVKIVALIYLDVHFPGEIPGRKIDSAFYNAEVGLWVEPTDTGALHIGHKTNGQKQGIWTLWDMDGAMIRQDYYMNDCSMYPKH